MAKESEFVAIAQAAAEKVLVSPLSVIRSAALLYQVTLDNELNPDPPVEQLREPRRGNSAFQTDLCVFEKKGDLSIPRVVMEFKRGITTHDVLTYSAKARKHKQVYPYLRYGIICSELAFIPGRVFTHNEALDFCAAIADYRGARLSEILEDLIRREVECSRRMEELVFDKARAFLFRTDVIVKKVGSTIA
jgi:hypothetical protein